MIHPSRLWRTNEQFESSFAAPRHTNLRLHNFDCGLKAIPWLTHRFKLHKYAKIHIFVTVASILGYLQGAALFYFKSTSHIWRQHYNFSENSIDYFIYSSDIFTGCFALIIGYWGNRIHRASWIGALGILHSIAGFILIVPELHNPLVATHNVTLLNEAQLCLQKPDLISPIVDDGKSYIAATLFMCHQMFYSFSYISLITHSITYIDDHVMDKNSAIHMSIIFAVYEFGKYSGMYLSWFPIYHKSDHIFVSAMWIILVCLILIFGIVIAMFPKVLPSKLLKEGVESILNIAEIDDDDDVNEEFSKTNFLPTIKRLLTNKILLVNTLSAAFMNVAITNFVLRQNDFFRSRFYVSVGKDFSGYQESTQGQLGNNLTLHPLTALAIISTGFVIAMFKPKAKHLALWSVFVCIITSSLFTSFAFLRCEDSIYSDHGSALTFCNAHCNCPYATFSPVCVNQITFFSPCHAGCTEKNISSEQEIIYNNCTCALATASATASATIGTEGSCNADKCSYIWAIAQASSVLITVLLASAFITQLIINLRCVLEIDKASTLALQLILNKLLPYLPFKIIYDSIADNMCQSRNIKRMCNFYKEQFGIFLSLTTVANMLISTALAIWLVSLVNSLQIHGDGKDDKPMQELREMSTAPPSFVLSQSANSEDDSESLHFEIATRNSNGFNKADQKSNHSFKTNTSGDFSEADIDSELQLIQDEDKLKPTNVLETTF